MSSHESSVNTNVTREVDSAQQHLIVALNTFVQRCLRRSHQRGRGLSEVAPHTGADLVQETVCRTKEAQIGDTALNT